MSGKIHLAKTGDSRTRRKKLPSETAEQLEARQQLQHTSSFANYLIGKGFSNVTTQRYMKDSNRFLQWCRKENIEQELVSYADVLHFVQTHKEKIKQRTAGIYVNSIKHYFNFLAAAGKIAENPTRQIQIRGIKRKTLYNILSRQELDSLYHNYQPASEAEQIKNQNWFKTSVLTAKRNKVILVLMIYQGLTSHELAQLTEKDVKLREGKIFIAGGRRSEERELKLESLQVLDLMEYTMKTREQILQLTGKKTEKLFVSIGTSSNLHNSIERLIEKLHDQNEKVKSVKQIRASVITHWLKLYNLRVVQYMAGHRFVSSTEGYLINDLDDLQEDISKYHPIN